MKLDKLFLQNFDKSSWKSYRFEEIAHNISERIDPNNTDLKIYVGLEHIDSESLTIQRFGSPDDVNGQKLRFYKNDLIFGRRRAYQRKAAIADFDGFCSAHALVLRPRENVINKNLFPFFIHSDSFMEQAIKISVGSLSPTINWGTLKNQEFKLPPIDIQNQLVDLFRSLNHLENKRKDVELKFDKYCESLLHKILLEKNNYCTSWQKEKFLDVKLSDVLSIPKKEKATSIDLDKIITVRLHQKGVIKNSNIDGLKIGSTTYFIRKSGQFIYGKQNLFNGAFGIIPNELDGFLSSSDIPALNIDQTKILPEYLMLYLSRKNYYSSLEGLSSGSGSKRISEETLLDTSILLPSLNIQMEIIDQFKKLSHVKNEIKNNNSDIKKLMKSFTIKVF